jgi:hypothetical protein
MAQRFAENTALAARRKTGIGRGTVSGKKDLRWVLDHYYREDALHLFEVLEEPTARRVTERYLLRNVELMANLARLMDCSDLESVLLRSHSLEDRGAAERMAQLNRAAEESLRQRYEQARKEGDLRPDEDPVSLARLVLIIRHGLAVTACGGLSHSELKASARHALDGVLPEGR